MSALSANALRAAYQWHDGQVRKYDGVPYIIHPVEVMGLIEWAYNANPGLSCWHPNIDLIAAAAVLHDTIEDCGVNYEDYEIEFGQTTTESLWPLVMEVTQVSKPTDGNRAKRVALDREHYALSSPAGASIKLADMISNARGIKHAVSDGNKQALSFMPVYFAELADLVPLLKHGDPLLWGMANEWLR